MEGDETQLTTAFSLITEEYRSDSEEEGEVDFEETRKSRYTLRRNFQDGKQLSTNTISDKISNMRQSTTC